MKKEAGKLIADAWENPDVMSRLKTDAKAVAAEYGIAVPEGVELEAAICDDKISYVVLPEAGQEAGVARLETLPEFYGLGQVNEVIIAKVGKDPEFRKLVLSDTNAALNQIGVTVPEGHEIKVVENTAGKKYLVVPQAPSAEMSAEDLDKVAGGGAVTTAEVAQAVVEAAVEATTAGTTAEVAAEVVAAAVIVAT